ncbi:winged helix-turn-helix domain-containing protein [Actinomadura chokoriensis]|uniref:Transcriptional regulator n=1 Tax=Actinomadura chokoriensis TaxID=454156 RepID=A0ABV4QT73_9ACTN
MTLDPMIHTPARLRMVALLATATEAEFAFVRDSLEMSDSVVSKHAGALEKAGYVEIRKGYVGKRPRTWFKLTPQGRRAFDEYVGTLQQIVGRPLANVPDDER